MTRSDSSLSGRTLFEGQLAHAVLLALLFVGLEVAVHFTPRFWEGELFGRPTRFWVIATLANAVLHQLYVWLAWRLQLYGSVLTRIAGPRAFGLYAAGFAILILARPVLVSCVAVANSGTLTTARPLQLLLAALMLPPAVYLLVSVNRYFGFRRAFGIDHFDPTYRSAKLERRGIFRYSSNAMYVFGFFAIWIPGLITGSVTALWMAAFSHAYIWVHYACTERPDMKQIYGSQ